jgi:hypothetical protein
MLSYIMLSLVTALFTLSIGLLASILEKGSTYLESFGIKYSKLVL